MARKTYYYQEDKSDDFGNLARNGKPLKDHYKYETTNVFYRFFSFCLYYFIAYPILWVIAKVFLGVKVKGKKELKKQWKKKEGLFIYSNHCHYFDAFLSQVFIGFPKKTHVISHADPMNVRGLCGIVKMLGGIPLPSTMSQYKQFSNVLRKACQKGKAIAIYPEGTLWPYYNGLRPMPRACFKYPAMMNTPVVFCAETWRKPKVFKFLKQRLTLTLSTLIRPEEGKSIQENTDMIYQKAEQFFQEHVLVPENISYHTYLPIVEKKK